MIKEYELNYSVILNEKIMLKSVSYESALLFLSKIDEQQLRDAKIIPCTLDGKFLLHD